MSERDREREIIMIKMVGSYLEDERLVIFYYFKDPYNEYDLFYSLGADAFFTGRVTKNIAWFIIGLDMENKCCHSL